MADGKKKNNNNNNLWLGKKNLIKLNLGSFLGRFDKNPVDLTLFSKSVGISVDPSKIQ